MFSSFNDCMLTFIHPLMIICFYAHMLTLWIDYMFDCSHVHRLWWWHAPMFTFLDNYMLLLLNSLILTCSHTYMLWWSHAPMLTCINILKFDIHTLEETLGWWFIYMLKGLSEHAVRRSCTQMLWRLCLNAKRYVYLGI